jgi:hypothetical protein
MKTVRSAGYRQPAQKMPFLFNCVGGTGERHGDLINWLKDHADQVPWRDFAAHAEWEAAAADMGYNVGRQRGSMGMPLYEDYGVDFFRVDPAAIDGLSCYYFRHSGIEHVYGQEQLAEVVLRKIAEEEAAWEADNPTGGISESRPTQ